MMLRTIHVVEDDDALRYSLELLLSLQPGLAVCSYKSAEEFLRTVPALPSGVLLLDYRMPGKTGIDVLGEIADDPRFATIMLTGQGDVALAVQVMKMGAFDFIEKPAEQHHLIRTIHQAFERLATRRQAADGTAAAFALVDRLSAREMDVFRGLVCGWSNKAIAHRLGVSPRTVEIHRANMMTKLEVRSLSDALRLAFAAGLAETFLAEGL